MTTTTPTRDRPLSAEEIHERTAALLALLDDQDEIRKSVRASRDALRDWRVAARELAAHIDQVRQEIRTGTGTEPAQPELPFVQAPPLPDLDAPTLDELIAAAPLDFSCPAPHRQGRHEIYTDGHRATCRACGRSQAVDPLATETEDECSGRTVRDEMGVYIHDPCLDAERNCGEPACPVGISGSSDEPDADTDPPAARPDPYAMFEMNYPRAHDQPALFDALHGALTAAEYAKLDGDTVRKWHPASGIFHAVARWCQVQNAHRTHLHREPTKGITIPARHPMPGELARALATSRPKGKAQRKATAQRKSPPTGTGTGKKRAARQGKAGR